MHERRGNKWVKTPNMDSLAAGGVYFTNSYSPIHCAVQRGPLCTRAGRRMRLAWTTTPCRSIRRSPVGQIFRAAATTPAMPASGTAGCVPAGWHRRLRGPEQHYRVGKLAQVVDEATMNVAVEFIRRKRENRSGVCRSSTRRYCLPAGETSPILDEVWNRYQPQAGAELPPLPQFRRPPGLPEDSPQAQTRRVGRAPWRKFAYAYYRMMEDVDKQVGQVLQPCGTGQENNTLISSRATRRGSGSHRWTGKMMYYQEEAACR